MNLYNYFMNPHSNHIKKYLFEILKNDYSKHDKFIERFCAQLSLKEDAQSFVELLGDIYKNGYLVAANQHKDELKKMGIDIKITSPMSDGNNKNKIFNQKNQESPEME